MRKSTSEIVVILSGTDLINDHVLADPVFEMVGTNTKDLIEMFIQHWGPSCAIDMYNGGSFSDRNGYNVPQLSGRLLVMDLIFGEIERRYEASGPPFREEDRKVVEMAMTSLWASVALYVFETLQLLSVTPEQLEGLEFDRWDHNDIVLLLPA